MTGLPMDEDDDAATTDLQAGLVRLAGLVADTLSLQEVLSEVSAAAVRAVAGAEGAGLAMVGPPDARVVASASSASFVAELDALQYWTLWEGPGVTAMDDRRSVWSNSLGGERLWPHFGPRAGRAGVHSALAMPLTVSDRMVGALCVYARGKGVFDDSAAGIAELFSAPAAVAVHNARVLSDARALAGQLRAALSTRPIIDQAIGIIRSRTGRTAGEAFDQLRDLSQSEQRKLSDVAERVVEEAVRRVRNRH
ncbi:ANTAR domain-containing protein [Mycolicibacterium sp. 22603]|uniref:ANTAR domain-containing protein n=1 Tax=Mycolicibacterium sp. 22603 TaxID=3453950 RepID=UPI003F87732D